MSIFNGTFSKYVAGQVTARKEVVNVPERGSEFMQFTTAKNSWVRMVSMTNVGGSDALSRQWALHGGVPINGTTSNLRYGVGNGGDNGVYFSNLNNDPKKTSVENRPYGYRPMPGITSVQSINKGTFGSLRQTTVKFFCWDKNQLSQLEKLYMRPGFSVFVEWGWSLYIDHQDPSSINSIPSSIKINNLVAYPIDPFAITDINNTYTQINNACEKYKGNYYAALGYVTNYSWQMLPNGGFECSTVILSHGNAINEIKSSSNPFTILGSQTINLTRLGSTLNSDPSANPILQQPVLSNFEKIFLNLKAYKNQAEIYDPAGEFYIKYDNSIAANDPIRLAGSQEIKDTVIKTVDKEIRETIQSYSQSHPFLLSEGYKTIKYSYPINPAGSPFSSSNTWIKPTNGSSNGNGFEYIWLGELFEILEVFFVPKDSNGKAIIKLIQPYKGRFAMCEDTVSIDPTICLFSNPNAEFLVNGQAVYNRPGFQPYLYSPTAGSLTTNTASIWENPLYAVDVSNTIGNRKNDNQPVYSLNLGDISVNIDCILETYRSLISSDGVSIIDFLNALLEKISFALGGINDFKIYNTNNTIQVIDTKYLEISSDPDGSYSSKYKFDLIGLKSVCRDVKINSRVFSEQASMVAIAAANAGKSGNTQANLGDLYTSTQQHLNYNLQDRLIREAYVTDPADAVGGGGLDPKLAPYYDLYWNTIDPLEKYLQRKVIGSGSVADPTEEIIIPTQDEIQNAYSLLNTHLLQLNGKDLDYKAIIPFELEITLDGIAGFNIGEVYTIDESVLPEVYTGTKGQDRKVGFILTGVQQDLHNNDWTTSLKGQMCLLDNDKINLPFSKTEKDTIKQIIQAIRAGNKKIGYLAWAMVDYLIFQTINTMSKDGTNKINKPFLSGTNSLDTFDATSGTCEDNYIFPYKATISTLWTKGITNLGGNFIRPVLQSTPKTKTSADTDSKGKGLEFVRSSVASTFAQIPFYDRITADETRTNTYLYKWWKEASTKGYPDFPATFKEILVYDDGLGTTVDMSPHLYSPDPNVVTANFDRWIYDENTYFSSSKVSGNELFLYREFDGGANEYTPAVLLRTNYSKESEVNSACAWLKTGGTSVNYANYVKAVALDLNLLRDKYKSLVFLHMISDWGADGKFVRNANTAAASLESDLNVNYRTGTQLGIVCDGGGDATVTPQFQTSHIPWNLDCKNETTSWFGRW